MRIIDVDHLGRSHVIGACLLDGVLLDPGPESCVETLLDGLGDEVPRALLLTHIHFDHAGAAGALVRRWPDLPVYVHRRGARHLADPERLVTSATRLYGEDGMRRLWGEVVPVPEDNLHPLDAGGELLDGDFRFRYTPGHASHHVCYLHTASGTAVVGDVAGVRIPPSDLVIAPTPPPDIDCDAWQRSLDLVAEWRPTALALTHFGVVEDVEEHIDEVRAALRDQAALVRHYEREEFAAHVRRRLAERIDAATAEAYLQAAPPDHLWLGLARWWHQRDESAA